MMEAAQTASTYGIVTAYGSVYKAAIDVFALKRSSRVSGLMMQI